MWYVFDKSGQLVTFYLLEYDARNRAKEIGGFYCSKSDLSVSQMRQVIEKY